MATTAPPETQGIKGDGIFFERPKPPPASTLKVIFHPLKKKGVSADEKSTFYSEHLKCDDFPFGFVSLNDTAKVQTALNMLGPWPDISQKLAAAYTAWHRSN